MAEYRTGSIVKCQVTGIEKYGAFVNIDGIVTRNTYKRLDLISLWFENRNRTKDEYLYLPYGVLVIRYQGLHYFSFQNISHYLSHVFFFLL